MTNIKVTLANEKNRNQLNEYFKHYQIKEIIKNRVNCYISHNFTIVAKEKNIIVGVLQWYVKEDPKAGVIEFEEIHVKEEYRGKGIGSMLIKFAIQSVKNYFNKMKIKPRKIFLFVNKENKIARNLYEKQGFKFVSEVGNLFSDKDTELFYILDLSKKQCATST
jgi:ribosomal protein S18 acetylase RimI-like enzyme